MRAPGTSRDDLLNFLVALVNTIGIPVVIIGTPAALPLLQGAFRQARRASGQGSLIWNQHTNDNTWNYFIDQMWQYQWTREHTQLDGSLRHILYEESQGIVDLVVKLYMLTQLHAIQLNSATGGKRGEKLTVDLFKHVAGEAFRLLAPMITALKRNDRAALEQYDDLRPLNNYVLQTFQAAIVRLSPTPCETIVAPQEALSASSVQDGSSAVLASLEALGLAPDIAQVLLAQVKAENPEFSPLDLVATIGEKLRDRGPDTKKVKARPKQVKGGNFTRPIDPADLRVIVSETTPPRATAYDALLTAGAIRPPLRDIAV